MKEFKRRRTIKQILYSPLTLILLTVVVFFLARAMMRVYANERSSYAELQSAERNIDELGTRKDFLEREIGKLKSKEGLEEALREKFPVVKEGEKMVIIVEPSANSTSTSENVKTGFWQSILNFFR